MPKYQQISQIIRHPGEVRQGKDVFNILRIFQAEEMSGIYIYAESVVWQQAYIFLIKNHGNNIIKLNPLNEVLLSFAGAG